MGWDPRSWGVTIPRELSSAEQSTSTSTPAPVKASRLPPAPEIAGSQAPTALATYPPPIAPTADGTPVKPPVPQASASKSVDEQYREFKAIMGLGLVGVCPLLMLLPPRRFNAVTVLQAGMFGWGVNEQTSWRTGHDVIWHYNRWVTGGTNGS